MSTWARLFKRTETGYIIVGNPKPRILPQKARAWLGERYMFVSVYPHWTDSLAVARRFVGIESANLYIFKEDGTRRIGMDNAIVRAVRLE